MQVETPTPSTHQLNGLELMDKNPSGANALSATINQTIPQKDKCVFACVKLLNQTLEKLKLKDGAMIGTKR